MSSSSPPLVLVVDLASPVPPFEQVRQQVAAHVSAGRLVAGDRLPTVRALAADLGIAVGTVARAYRELEAGGLVLSRRRLGTVVAGGSPDRPGRAATGVDDGPAATPRTSGVHAAAAELVERARAAGWSDDAVLTAVRGALLAPGPSVEVVSR